MTFWILVAAFATDIAVFSNRDACEHEAWSIEVAQQGHAIYDKPRCISAQGMDASPMISVTINGGHVYYQAHDNLRDCSAFVSSQHELQWSHGKHPHSAWCTWTDKPVQVDVQQ